MVRQGPLQRPDAVGSRTPVGHKPAVEAALALSSRTRWRWRTRCMDLFER